MSLSEPDEQIEETTTIPMVMIRLTTSSGPAAQAKTVQPACS